MIEGRNGRRRAGFALAALAPVLAVGAIMWAGTHRAAQATTATPSPAIARRSPAAAEAPSPRVLNAPPAVRPSQPAAGSSASAGPPITTGDDRPPGGTAEPPLPPLRAQSAGLMVRFHPGTRWDGGLVGFFDISNTTSEPVNGWRLAVTVPRGFTVTASWEATMHQAGNRITFTSTPTSARLEVGATVRFGLQANTERPFNGPDTCSINDAACA
jgi:hypothetical protein